MAKITLTISKENENGSHVITHYIEVSDSMTMFQIHKEIKDALKDKLNINLNR
jgi:hypothetical protein